MWALSHVHSCDCVDQMLMLGVFLHPSPSYFLRQASHWAWNSVIQWSLLASELQGFACSPPSIKVLLYPEFTWVSGIWTQVRMFTQQAIDLTGCLPAAFTVKQLETDGRWWLAYLWLSTSNSSVEGRPPLMYVSVLFRLTNGSWRQCIGLCVFFMSHYISGMCICRKTSICLKKGCS